MARNAPDPNQRTSSRVTKAPVQRDTRRPATKSRQDRRRFWIKVVSALLVLAMLLPVIAVFL